LAGHADRITDCIVEETNHRLLTASWDKSVALWDMSGSATKKIWCDSESSLLLSCDFNLNHQLVVAAADSGHYHVWDVRSGEKVTTVKGHTNTVTCCRFDFGGNNLCTCSMDRRATVWDIRMWKHLLKLRDHKHTVSCCAFSHNNHWLLTGSWDTNLHLYNVADGSFRSQGPVVLGQHRGCVSSCNFSKDDSLIVSAGYDSNVNVWCNHTHQLRNTYKGHTSWIKDAKFGKDRKWIVTGDKNGEVRLWDTEAGNESKRKGHHMLPGTKNSKCCRCGEMFAPITISRPHNLKLNSGLCLLCQCRAYVDFDVQQ
jgi:WD40 repeat protein